MTFGEKGGITMFYFFKNNVKSKYDKMLLILGMLSAMENKAMGTWYVIFLHSRQLES